MKDYKKMIKCRLCAHQNLDNTMTCNNCGLYLQNPLLFQDGDKSENINKFITLLDKYRDAGKEILYSGTLYKWLKESGEEHYALKADHIIKTEKNKDKGLENILEILGAKKPELSLFTKEINMGTIFQGKEKKISFQISNKGRGYLYGTVTVNDNWCHLSSNVFEGNLNNIEITVKTEHLAIGQTCKTIVSIKTNGGNFELPVIVKIIFPWQKVLSYVNIGIYSGIALILILRFILKTMNINIDAYLRPSVYNIFNHGDNPYLIISWIIFGAFLGILFGLASGFNKVNKKAWNLLLIIPFITIIVFLGINYSKPVITISASDKISVKIYDRLKGLFLILDASNYNKEITNSTIEEIQKESREALVKDKYGNSSKTINYLIVPLYKDWHKKGCDYLEKKELEKALNCFNKALELNPEYSYAWHKKGLIFEKQKNYLDAIKCYDRALESDPSNIFNWNDILKADMYYKSKKYDEAVKCYDRALAIEAKNKTVIINRGKALNYIGKQYFSMGKYKEAIKLYSKILKSEPDNLEALVGKAKGLYRIYNYKQGKELFQRVLNLKKLSREQKKSIRDSYIDSSLTLGQNYLKDKDYDKAILLFCDVRDKDPKNLKAKKSLAICYLEKGKKLYKQEQNYISAEEYFYAVIDLKPGGTEEKTAKDYINRIASAYAQSAPPSVQPVYETYYQNVSTPNYTEIDVRE